jgi:prepilin-type N-terminal cleavage/methylation domain-containing protein
MLHKLKNRKEEGFTIIEVLIVLAIAGLILLIVFLAVPALQRNSRNTSRKTDVGRVSGALQEWQSNHNGATFTAGAGGANVSEVINSAGTLSQYTPAYAATIGANSFTVVVGATGALTGGVNNVNLGSLQVATGATCDTATAGAAIASSSNRRMALQYLVEQGTNGVTPQCLDVQ